MHLRHVVLAALLMLAACGYNPTSSLPDSGQTCSSLLTNEPDASGFSHLAYYEAGGYPLLVTAPEPTFPTNQSPQFDTWKWDCGWQHQGAPSDLGARAMAYDPALKKVVLVGAKATLGWDGPGWAILPAIHQPPVYSRMYMAFDQARNQLVLLDVTDTVMETWIYDGGDWRQVNVSAGPSVGSSDGFAYDPRSKTILLFGVTYTASAGLRSAMWSWDGTSWKELHPSSMPPDVDVSMAYDGATQQIILVALGGGTWNWNGTSWARLAIPSPLPAANDASIVYDAAHRQLFLLGIGEYVQGSQTWTYDGRWRRLLPRPGEPPPASSARGSSPEPSPSSSSGSGARTTGPSPAPTGAVVCRIPYADLSEATGGFIAYPSGDRANDPRATVALPGNTPGAIGVNPGLSYIPSLDAWVPVPQFWVVPASSFYVYQTNGRITEVWIADGRTVDVLQGGLWSIVGATDAGIYVVQNGAGAYWMAFGSQGPVQIVDHGTWFRYSGNALWGVDGGYLVRHDLTTNVDTRWGQMSAQNWIAGFDGAGNPIVNVGGALILHHADGSTVTIWPGTNGLSAAGYVFGDAIGVEFLVGGGLVGAPGHGVYVWTASAGARLISAYEANVAGPCGP